MEFSVVEADPTGTRRLEKCFINRIIPDSNENVQRFLRYVQGFDICATASFTRVENDNHITMGILVKRPTVRLGPITIMRPERIRLPNGGDIPILTLTSS